MPLNDMNLLRRLVQALGRTAFGYQIVFTNLDIGLLRDDTGVNCHIHSRLNLDRFPWIKRRPFDQIVSLPMGE